MRRHNAESLTPAVRLPLDQSASLIIMDWFQRDLMSHNMPTMLQEVRESNPLDNVLLVPDLARLPHLSAMRFQSERGVVRVSPEATASLLQLQTMLQGIWRSCRACQECARVSLFTNLWVAV